MKVLNSYATSLFKIEFIVHFIDRLNVDDEFYQNDFGAITDGIASL